jgi:DNA polymerase I-like protein with 3'-5' exonuclease and polymerase domains
MGAFIANEQTIIENYRQNPSWDPHTWFAARLYGCSEEEVRQDTARAKEENRGDGMRQIAKSANFSQLYLGDGHTIQSYAAREMGIALPYELCERTHKAWHQAFPGWAAWYMRVKADLIERGYTESPTGRRRNYGDFSLLAFDQRLSALRELCNAMVQGFCADIALIALGACHQQGLPLVDFVHDEFSFEFVSMDEARAAELTIRKCLIDEPLRVLREEFNVVPTTPLEIEGSYRLHKRPNALD